MPGSFSDELAEEKTPLEITVDYWKLMHELRPEMTDTEIADVIRLTESELELFDRKGRS